MASDCLLVEWMTHNFESNSLAVSVRYEHRVAMFPWSLFSDYSGLLSSAQREFFKFLLLLFLPTSS